MWKSPINFERDLLSQLCAGVYILPFNIWQNIVLEALLCIDLCDRGYMSPSIHICIISRTNHLQWNIRIKLLTTVDLVRLDFLINSHLFHLLNYISYQIILGWLNCFYVCECYRRSKFSVSSRKKYVTNMSEKQKKIIYNAMLIKSCGSAHVLFIQG